MVEDSEDDARLLYSELTRTNSDITYTRVDCAEDMRKALLDSEWDIVISDHSMPRFSSLEALDLLKECGKDIPFIIYSGDVSEHVEVAAMCSGAQDSIVKGNFARLLPAMEREIHGAAVRRAKEQADAHVHKLAFYDRLTGLPNRNLFCDHVGRKLPQAEGRSATIYVLDIDRFLRVNNCFGHKVGDALMRQIAQRLQECVPEDGMVARCGSDEFAVFLGNVASDQQARDAAEHIRQAFSRPFVEGTLEFFISLSIGIGVSPRDGDDVPELLINAETAMFRAKSMGGNNTQFYAHEMGAVAGAQLVLESALRKAVARRELLLEYQPNLNAVSGALTGVEALVRWRHPEMGVLQPDDFIPLANESGLITEIGAWVLESACRQAKAWHDAGHPGLTIAVNVSAVQFWQPGLVQAVARVLADTGIDPQCLELEITESVLMRNADTTIMTLQALKGMRVKISVDDFGTGYSSLSYLRRFPIDILKIDKSFSRDVMRDVESAAIVQAIGALARGLGLVTVAEGVETTEQLEFFRRQHCDRVQGFLFSAPRSVADITEMLGARAAAQALPQQKGIARPHRMSGRVGKILTQEFARGAA
ncbi:MAG: GGDEF domain-containing response regulator [Betaproteobacteria bacterium]|nr:GGDEF domain-containing response regulator [Betaproteobacteria bacterium]